MKLIRNVLLITLLFFIFAIATLWAVSHFVQPETFRNIAKKQLTTLTHHDSAIEGNVSWEIFPRLGLNVTNVHIGDPNLVKQDQTDYALSVDNLLFHVQIMPLFRGKLVFDQLILDGFTLSMTLDQPNAPTTTRSTPVPSNPTTRTKPKPPFSLPSRIALKSLLLSNGNILIKQKDEQFILTRVRLESEFPTSAHASFPIQLKATLKKGLTSSPLQGSLTYKGLLRLPPLDQINASLASLELDGQMTLQNIQYKNYQITKANAHTLFKNGELQFNPLTLSLYNGESVGQLNYKLDSRALTFNQTGTKLNSEPVFQALFQDQPQKITGLLDFSIRGNTYLTAGAWPQKTKLDGTLTLRDGMLTYVDLPAITQKATQTIHALANQNIELIQQTISNLAPWRLNDFSGTTPFQLLNFQYQLKTGNLLEYSFLLETKKLHLKGQGLLNTDTQELHADLIATITTKDKTVQTVQQLLGQGFPLKVTGTLDNPLVHADQRALRHLVSDGLLPKHIVEPLKQIHQQLKFIKHQEKSSEPTQPHAPE